MTATHTVTELRSLVAKLRVIAATAKEPVTTTVLDAADAIDGMLARLAAAEADAEAGWKWAWRFDQWFGDSATSELDDEERAEFQADLTCHENYWDPR